jgi:hypothetical protein
MISPVFAVVLRVADLGFAISKCFEFPASPAHRDPWGVCAMDYEIDLCPTHSCIRLTVMVETMTEELAEEIYRHLAELTSEGGPYAAIFDLSATKITTISTDAVRSWGRHRPPAVPMGACPLCNAPRKQVVVGTEPVIFGLARVFEMCADAQGSEFQVAHTIQEAYEITGVHPEDFTECMIWPCETTSSPRRVPLP